MLNISKYYLLFVLLCSLSACVSFETKQSYYVAQYSDFGPPVIATDLIGVDWWQWQSHGDSRPKDYDIKVIVYSGASAKEIKKKFPLDPDRKKDFRYIDFLSAVEYLDRNIEENILESVTTTLINTRAKILEELE
ncbi:hypothetical protein ACFL2V_12860 [Pseudomonadota bacterium]